MDHFYYEYIYYYDIILGRRKWLLFEMDRLIIERIRKFTKDRNWEQLHIGENLAKSLVLELADY